MPDEIKTIPAPKRNMSRPYAPAAPLISQALVALDVVKASPFSRGYQLGYHDGMSAAWKQAAREWATRQRKQAVLAQTIIRN